MRRFATPFGLRRNGIPLADLEKVKGKWQSSSQTFNDLQVANAWGLKPSEYWASSDPDKIYMTAYSQAVSEIRAVEDRETEKQIARTNRRSGRHK